MTNKQVTQVFDRYERERLTFAQSLAEIGGRLGCAEAALSLGSIPLLAPLLNDPSAKVQQVAALALARALNASPNAALEAAKKHNIIPTLLRGIGKKSKYYKKSGMLALKGLGKHSAELGSILVNEGGLEAVVDCLEDFDACVKEAATWAAAAVASHNQFLAQSLITVGAIPLLKMCLQEPEVCLKQAASSALGEIAKHGLEHAQEIVDSMAIPYMVKSLCNPDPRLKKQILCCMANVAKHSLNLAEVIVEADIFPEALIHLGHPDPQVAKAAANLTKEIVKHHVQLSQLVVNSGGLVPLILLTASREGADRLGAIMALGYIAAQSSSSSSAIIASRGIEELVIALLNERCDYVKCALVWTLGQIGKHGPEHAKALALAGVFPLLIQNYEDETSSADLKEKCKGSCKQVITRCKNLPSLEPLVASAPPDILKYVLEQFAKQLPKDPVARRMFVTSGNLKRVQEVEAQPGSSLMEYINIIRKCFPEELIRYYTPGYSESLLHEVETYVPQIPALLHKNSIVEDMDDINLMTTINDPPAVPQSDVCE